MNEQVKVRITGQAITARYGTLSTGDQLVTDAAFAKHLVEDCGAAEYVKAGPEAPATKAAAASKEVAASKTVGTRKAASEAKAKALLGDVDNGKLADSVDIPADPIAPAVVDQSIDVQTSAQPGPAGGVEDVG